MGFHVLRWVDGDGLVRQSRLAADFARAVYGDQADELLSVAFLKLLAGVQRGDAPAGAQTHDQHVRLELFGRGVGFHRKVHLLVELAHGARVDFIGLERLPQRSARGSADAGAALRRARDHVHV